MEKQENVNVIDSLMSKETVNVVDNLANSSQSNSEPMLEQQSSIWAWVSLALAVMVAPVGLMMAIYAYLSNRNENREIEVVSLMSAGIAAALCVTAIIQFIV